MHKIGKLSLYIYMPSSLQSIYNMIQIVYVVADQSIDNHKM